MKFTLLLLFLLVVNYRITADDTPYANVPALSQVNGYHFHTLFLASNPASVNEVQYFRDNLLNLVNKGFLYDCIVGSIFNRPIDEYPVGNFVTCCNSTALDRALPYFSLNHGQLSVFVHPLTRANLLDHTDRAMWIGRPYPLDYTNTVVYRPSPQVCIPRAVP